MSRRTKAEPIYRVANEFRERCLLKQRSLLWPDHAAWTVQNLRSFKAAFIDRPDTSDRPFLEKFRDQLADQSEDVHRIAADLVAFYWLVPTNVTAQKKLKDVATINSWKIRAGMPSLTLLEDAYQTGVVNPGAYYLISGYWQLSFYLEFSLAALSAQVNPNDAKACRRIADETLVRLQHAGPARHMLLHMFFPDQFQPIASEDHRQKIFSAFRNLAGTTTDVDEGLQNIERALEQQLGHRVSWYGDNEIRQRWDIKKKTAQEPTSPAASPSLQCWVEKTLVRGRPYKEHGEYALGKALWSPQEDKVGKNIYRFMRKVQPGDIVLHLTDNQGFTGISRVSASVTEFEGVPNSEWGEGPFYLVRLRDFIGLDPILSRDRLFSTPFRERLIALLDAGKRNLFYNREPALNQGAYLTPAPPELVAILDDAYRSVTHKSLVDVVPDIAAVLAARRDGRVMEVPEAIPEFEMNPEYTLAQCANETGLDVSVLERWIQAVERKGQAIIYGPPGTGKTFVAERLARHLISGTNGFTEVVQFHPAYAYEDFVLGIRPKTRPEGGLDYPSVPGRFLEFCAKAERRQARCVLIIDEINRANLARVLGELMYLLEYRDREIPLATGMRFRIPQNVRVIGTMNTADRSIALVDHALRRRFAFLALRPNYEILKRFHHRTGINVDGLISVLQSLNAEIGDYHYEVGVSFFLRDDLTVQIEDIWRMEIEPYLEEFFFDQPDKVARYRWDQVREKIRL